MSIYFKLGYIWVILKLDVQLWITIKMEISSLSIVDLDTWKGLVSKSDLN